MDKEARDFEKRRAIEAEQAGQGELVGRSGSPAETYGLKQASAIMDKRIAISMLHNRAGELRRQAEGVERLAQLLGAASDHDYHLFAAVIDLINRR